jgi:hypothetical protein
MNFIRKACLFSSAYFPGDAAALLVGGMTPGMPKACQTGWFEPSRYRLDIHSGEQS